MVRVHGVRAVGGGGDAQLNIGMVDVLLGDVQAHLAPQGLADLGVGPVTADGQVGGDGALLRPLPLAAHGKGGGAAGDVHAEHAMPKV
jgi:hypothetical protein